MRILGIVPGAGAAGAALSRISLASRCVYNKLVAKLVVWWRWRWGWPGALMENVGYSVFNNRGSLFGKRRKERASEREASKRANERPRFWPSDCWVGSSQEYVHSEWQ